MSKSSKPNVILITIDALRADKLGTNKNKRSITPNLDFLASRGIYFNQAITGGSWTQAAFPTLLTSSYASMYGGCLGPLSPERPSPIETLSKSGYTTGGFVTSPLLSKTYGYHRGFNHFVDLLPNQKDPYLRQIRGGHYILQNPFTHFISKLLGKNTRPPRLYISAEEVNQEVFHWIENTQTPFFAWIHYMDVHWPYHLEEDLERPKDIAQAWRDQANLHNFLRRDGSISQSQKVHYVDLYDKAVHYADAQVGKIINYLENNQLGDNTIVIVVSDHGEEFLEHNRWGHVELNLYDEIIKVPLIFKIPLHPGGQIIDNQVRTLDIMPTVLDLCDCPIPESVEGKSLAPLWSDDQTQYNNNIAISERWRNEGDISHIIAVRTDQYKYIWDINKPDQPQLYDLQTDPLEQFDVCDQHPEIVEELHTIVTEHLSRATQTTPENAVSIPDLDEDVIKRLRDLGYFD